VVKIDLCFAHVKVWDKLIFDSNIASVKTVDFSNKNKVIRHLKNYRCAKIITDREMPPSLLTI